MSRSSAPFSRLRFLALAAGLAFLPACAAATPRPATATPAVTGPYDVIIVGAGIAGLAAAKELRHLRSDYKILVLEATNHVGGRGYTHRMASGTPIDLGGAWVHGVPTNPLTSLVDGMGFTRVKTDLSTSFYTPRGLAPECEQKGLRAAIEAFEERAQEGAVRFAAADLDHAHHPTPPPPPAPCQEHPVGDNAADYLPCNAAPYLDLIRANSGPLESTAELDATSATETAEFAAGEDDLVKEGMGEFVKALGETMKRDSLAVRLEAPVTAIRYGAQGVTITTAEHGARQTYEARRVLVTVSTGVLRTPPALGGIAFDPELPKAKRDALDKLPMGLMNKIILDFKDEVLDKAPPDAWVLYQADTVDQNTKRKDVMAFALRPFGSKRIAIGFVGGKRAWDLEKECEAPVKEGKLVPENPAPQPCDAAAINAVEDALQKMFPAVAGAQHAVYVTRWGLVSWSRGAYSAARPGQSKMHDELAKPIPFPTSFYGTEKVVNHGDTRAEDDAAVERRYRVFFAGEGTARPIYSGSFPGAWESGLVAARALANSLAAEAIKPAPVAPCDTGTAAPPAPTP